MAALIVLLVVTVALGRGGYDPWAMLVLEVGAAAVFLWLGARILWTTRSQERAAFLEQKRAWKRLPFLARHPGLASVLHLLSLGLLSKRRGGQGVEILPPGVQADAVRFRPADQLILWGFPLRRTGIGLPLFTLTLWILLSVVPIGRETLQVLSPQANSLRTEAEKLVDPQAGAEPAPWSLTPFLTLRSSWLWLAYLALFYAAAHLSENSENVERLSLAWLLVGVVFGVWGVAQWILGLRDLFGVDPSTAGLRATGSFGNRNHYAAFMGMMLLASVGWFGYRWARISPSGGAGSFRRAWGRVDVMTQEAKARLFLAGLAIVVLGLGLIFSLSRSGISFGFVGCAAFALLASPIHQPESSGTIDLERSGKGRRPHGDSYAAREDRSQLGRRRHVRRVYWALALAVLGVAFWIGIEPVVTRFQLIPEEWEAERGRVQVWKDSLGAVRDFWLTGSGLSSFRYVYPIYRSFGGQIFYSWAHNDYLQVLIELGLPGLALVSWLIASVWLKARRVRRRLRDHPPLIHLHAGYCAAAIAVALHSATDFCLHMPANAALLSVVVGVVVGLGEPRRGPRQGRAESPASPSDTV